MNSLVIKHECRDESEIYNYQRIHLSHNGILVGKGGEGGGGGGGGYARPGLTVMR